jgi:Zn-dependent peptidase ImmA (M78 family)
MTNEARTEQICDYFAATLLMPKVWVRRAFVNGPQDLHALARTFGVSMSAMNVRLQSLGLIPKTPRCNVIQEAAA